MEIVRRIRSMKETSRQARARGQRIGFVPTMGFLHEGHLALIRKMNELTDVVVVSIFVNPTQFGQGEDFGRYPRDLPRDADLCIAEGVDYLFTPDAAEVYSPGPPTWVEVAGLSDRLEGASRPGHFRGVSTVVLKLFHIVNPHAAVFGQKDAQQSAVVRRMVADLLLDVEIVVVPTVRDDDGLALSSRNAYLSVEQRQSALAIPRALQAARTAFGEALVSPGELIQDVRAALQSQAGLELDYAELVDPDTFELVGDGAERALLVVAARCGETRLPDNELLRR